MKIYICLITIIFVVNHVTGECPCVFRHADPVFPGAWGSRWDCEYINDGLDVLPTQCWGLHSNVTQVFLDYNSLTEVSSNSFQGLDQLRTLSLKMNSLTSFDGSALKEMTSLEYLDVSDNKLDTIPDEVWDLTSLHFLSFSDNNIKELPGARVHNLVNLTVFDIHWNHLTTIPQDSFAQLKKLKKVHLFWNMFTELPSLMENLELEEVLINGNALLEFPKHMFGNLTKPLTYHFVDNPAYDVWASMLLPLPDRSHLMMANDLAIWAEDQSEADVIIAKDWVLQDGLQNILNIEDHVMICPSSKGRRPPHRRSTTRMPPC